MDILGQLQQAFAIAGSIVDEITADQLGLPTPCDDWTVAELLTHTIGVLDAFASRQPNPAATASLGADYVSQFATSAAAALATWSAPGGLQGDYTRAGRPPMAWADFAGINLVDTYTHAWDLAQATGQQSKIDEGLAGACLDTARRVVPDAARAAVGFKVPQPVGATEPASHQLAAFLGRTPA